MTFPASSAVLHKSLSNNHRILLNYPFLALEHITHLFILLPKVLEKHRRPWMHKSPYALFLRDRQEIRLRPSPIILQVDLLGLRSISVTGERVTNTIIWTSHHFWVPTSLDTERQRAICARHTWRSKPSRALTCFFFHLDNQPFSRRREPL